DKIDAAQAAKDTINHDVLVCREIFVYSTGFRGRNCPHSTGLFSFAESSTKRLHYLADDRRFPVQHMPEISPVEDQKSARLRCFHGGRPGLPVDQAHLAKKIPGLQDRGPARFRPNDSLAVDNSE